MIRITLAGKIGSPAEVKESNGKKFIKFSAYSSYKKSDGTYESTFVNCTWFTEKADILAPYLTKGKGVYIEGTPSAHAYLKDNNPEASMDCTVRTLELCGDSLAASGQTQAPQQKAPAAPQQPVQNTADDLPF